MACHRCEDRVGSIPMRPDSKEYRALVPPCWKGRRALETWTKTKAQTRLWHRWRLQHPACEIADARAQTISEECRPVQKQKQFVANLKYHSSRNRMRKPPNRRALILVRHSPEIVPLLRPTLLRHIFRVRCPEHPTPRVESYC